MTDDVFLACNMTGSCLKHCHSLTYTLPMLRIDSKYTYHGSIGESCPWASLTVTGGFLRLPHGGSDVDLEYDEPTTNRPEPTQRSMGCERHCFLTL